MFYWNRLFLVGWDFSCSIWEKPFLAGLVDQLSGPVSNQVEMIKKVFVWLCPVIVAHIRTIPRSYHVSTQNSWKSVLLRNVDPINPYRLRLKWWIPIEHDLCVLIAKPNSCFELVITSRSQANSWYFSGWASISGISSKALSVFSMFWSVYL